MRVLSSFDPSSARFLHTTTAHEAGWGDLPVQQGDRPVLFDSSSYWITAARVERLAPSRSRRIMYTPAFRRSPSDTECRPAPRVPTSREAMRRPLTSNNDRVARLLSGRLKLTPNGPLDGFGDTPLSAKLIASGSPTPTGEEIVNPSLTPLTDSEPASRTSATRPFADGCVPTFQL